VAAYYVVSEMLTNATKHAHGSVVEVDAEAPGGTLRVCVRDDRSAAARSGCACVTTGSAAPIRYGAPGGDTRVCCELPVQAGAGYPDVGTDE
jgi:hypothetical protein